LAIASPISGTLADRGHARWFGPIGLGLAGAGLVLLAQIGVATPFAVIALWLAVSGTGQGLFLSPNTNAVMSAVPSEESGTASGLIATTRVVGQVLSVAIAGAVFIGLGGAAAGATLLTRETTGFDPALDATFLGAIHSALLVSAALAAAGAAISFAGIVGRGRRRSVDAGRARLCAT
jgi:hypothetical protein